MIVNIRGTSGSGKSHIIRAIMDQYGGKDSFEPVMLEDRKKPFGYYSTSGGLFIPGHYESQCGGCDTIHGQDTIFNLVRSWAERGANVLFEGLLVSEEVRRTVELARSYNRGFHVLAIDHPIEECLASINVRRRLRNPDAADVNPANTTNRIKVITRAMGRLTTEGIPARWGTRKQVLAWTKEFLC